jgi:hypothetical protein
MKIKRKHYKALQYASLIQRWKYLPSNFIFQVVQNSEVDVKNTHIKNKRYTLAMRLRSIYYAHSMKAERELLN